MWRKKTWFQQVKSKQVLLNSHNTRQQRTHTHTHPTVSDRSPVTTCSPSSPLPWTARARRIPARDRRAINTAPTNTHTTTNTTYISPVCDKPVTTTTIPTRAHRFIRCRHETSSKLPITEISSCGTDMFPRHPVPACRTFRSTTHGWKEICLRSVRLHPAEMWLRLPHCVTRATRPPLALARFRPTLDPTVQSQSHYIIT